MKKDNASISNTGEEKVMSIAEENKMSDHKATDQPLEPKKTPTMKLTKAYLVMKMWKSRN